MPRRVAMRLATLVVLLAMFALPMQKAGATQAQLVDGTFTFSQGSYTYFSHPRTVSYGAFGIALYKSDGPAFDAKWIYCGATYGGPQVSVPNTDPYGYVYLQDNYVSTTKMTFCLAFKGNGNDNPESFDGILDWDGYDGAY